MMSGERDESEKLRRFFAEVHARESPPPFHQLVRRRERRRPEVWTWATAAALGVALVAGWAVREIVQTGREAPASSREELALARSLSRPVAPLDFLLETPGSEFLGLPPGLAGNWIRLPQFESEQNLSRKENL